MGTSGSRWIRIGVLLSLVLAVLGGAMARGEVVDFPDPNLEDAVREALGKLTGDITVADMETLTQLGASDRGVIDLGGLEYARNLVWLDLSLNSITDISPLEGLAKLRTLDLQYNRGAAGGVSELLPLAGLEHLEFLDLQTNRVRDLSVLAGLTTLKQLDLSDNEIRNLSALAGLKNLTMLELWGNEVSDVGPLAGLTNLWFLSLGNNQISDLSPLAGLTNLTWLNLWDNEISDISPLAGLQNLTMLMLSYNEISDPGPLAGLTNLTVLILDGNEISDLSPLVGLDDLWLLQLQRNQIRNLSPLAFMNSITELYLDWNYISDISSLASLTNLERLDLVGNQISDISPLVTNSNAGGLGSGDVVYLCHNYLDLTPGSKSMQGIQTLLSRGVAVYYEPQRGLYTLTVNKMGEGTVEVDRVAVDLPYTAEYAETTEVELQAIAAEGWEFDRWEVDGEVAGGGDDIITVAMDDHKDALAYFRRALGMDEVQVGALVFYAEGGFTEVQDGRYEAQGIVTIRGEQEPRDQACMVIRAESVLVDARPSVEQLSGTGSLTLKEVPWQGEFVDIDLWYGDFGISIGSSSELSPDKVDTLFQLASLDVRIAKVRFDVDEDAGVLGGILLEEFLVFAHADFTMNSGVPSGYLRLTDLRITRGEGIGFGEAGARVENIGFAQYFTIEHIDVRYSSVTDELSASGRAACPAPFGGKDARLTFGVAFELKGGELQSLDLELEAGQLNKAIWKKPPVFLQRVAVGVSVDTDRIEVCLGVDLTLLPEAYEHYILKLGLELTHVLGSGGFSASGTVTVINDDFHVGSASVVHDPDPDSEHFLKIEIETGEELDLRGVVLLKGHLYLGHDGVIDGRFEAGKIHDAFALADITLLADPRGVEVPDASMDDPVFYLSMLLAHHEGIFTLTDVTMCVDRSGDFSLEVEAGKLFGEVDIVVLNCRFAADGIDDCTEGEQLLGEKPILCLKLQFGFLGAGNAEGWLYVAKEGEFAQQLNVTQFLPPEVESWSWFYELLQAFGIGVDQFTGFSVSMDNSGLRVEARAPFGLVTIVIRIEYSFESEKWTRELVLPQFAPLLEVADSSSEQLEDFYDDLVTALTELGGRAYEALPPDAQGVIDWAASTGQYLIDLGAGFLKGCDIMLTDAQGRRLGIRNGRVYEEIPEARVFVEGGERLILIPEDIDFQVFIFGTENTTADFAYALSGEHGATVSRYELELDSSTVATMTHVRGSAGESLHVDASGDGVFDQRVHVKTVRSSPRIATDTAPASFQYSPAHGLKAVQVYAKSDSLLLELEARPLAGLPDELPSPSSPVISAFGLSSSTDPELIGEVRIAFSIPSASMSEDGNHELSLLEWDHSSEEWRACSTEMVSSEDEKQHFQATASSLSWFAVVADDEPAYHLTIDSTEGGSVTEPGEGTFYYEHWTNVLLKVEAEEGYGFVVWTGDIGTIEDPEAAVTIIRVNDNYSITANFVATVACTEVAPGWTFFGLPGEPADTDFAALEFDPEPTDVQMFWWDPEAEDYLGRNDLELRSMSGYWLFLTHDHDEYQMCLEGAALAGEQELELAPPGWQMISVPYPVAWGPAEGGSIRVMLGDQEKTLQEAVDELWIYHTLYAWDTEEEEWIKHRAADGVTLEPWTGYFLFAIGMPPLPEEPPDKLVLIYSEEEADGLWAQGQPLSPAALSFDPGEPPLPPMLAEPGEGLTAVAYPSPVRDGAVTFAVRGPAALWVEEIRVRVHDVSGRLVHQGQAERGRLVWDTLGLTGVPVASGLYLYTVQAELNGEWVSTGVDRLLILR